MRGPRNVLSGLLVASIVVAGCSSDDGASSPTSDAAVTAAPTTPAPATTAPTSDPETTATAPSTTTRPSTSTSAPATTTAPSTTAAGPVTEGLDPPCTESTDAAGGAGEAVPVPETFGPLPAAPTLVVDLPAARQPAHPSSFAPVAVADLIEGGVLVAARSPSSDPFPGSLLAAVGVDGTIRWVRCLPGSVTEIYASPTAETALLRSTEMLGSATGTWQEVSLADGAVRPSRLLDSADPPATEPTDVVLASGDRTIVLGPADDTVIGADDRVTLYDFGSGGRTMIPFPEVALGRPFFELQFAFNETGQLLLLGGGMAAPAVLAVFEGEVWTEGTADLDEPLPIRTAFEFGDGRPVLTGYDEDGEVVWTNPTVAPFSGEGFAFASAGAVTIVAGCFEAVEESIDCDRHEVGGVDSATGEVLWQLPGDRGVGPVGDGVALVTDGEDPTGWQMIDAATGELVDDTQRWDDPTLFGTGCCGDEFNWTRLDGGVVVSAHDKRVAVWYPKSARLDPHAVSFG